VSQRREQVRQYARRRFSTGIVAAVFASLGILTVSGTGSANPALREIAPDTIRPTRLVLPKTHPLLETEYLRRLRASFRSRDLQAAMYSEQYRISTGLARTIIEAATAEGIDPDLVFRLVRVESVFQERAVSPKGALGLTQLMPGTARLLDRSLRSRRAILEPQTNLRLGFRFLGQMLKYYHGDVRLALLAYNRGPNAVNRALRSGWDPENGYSHKVLGTWGGNPYTGAGLVR
jgi:hypothetical protein